jgi:hypothetical protein
VPPRPPAGASATRIADALIPFAATPLGLIPTMGFEQEITGEEDALLPWNTRPELSAKQAAKKERDRNIPVNQDYPKIAQATSDVGAAGATSTNYGIFGISNVRTYHKEDDPVKGFVKGTVKGTSTMDAFVAANPDLKLPNPGGPGNKKIQTEEQYKKETDDAKKFTEEYQKLAKEQPVKLYNAQVAFYKKRFLDPAERVLKNKKWDAEGKPEDNEGVKAYLADRNVVGLPNVNEALKYAKDAKTPEEFIKLMSEYDMKNLRTHFTSTPLDQFLAIESGIKNRIIGRTNAALEVNKSSELTATEIKELKDIKSTLKPGEKRPGDVSQLEPSDSNIASLSTDNNFMRRNLFSSGRNVINQITNVISTGDEEIVTASFDDRPAFLRKKIYG